MSNRNKARKREIDPTEFGIKFRDWDESWDWLEEPKGQIKRFQKLQPATQYSDAINSLIYCQTSDIPGLARDPKSHSRPFQSASKISERPDCSRDPNRSFSERKTAAEGPTTDVVKRKTVHLFSEERQINSGTRSRFVWTFFTADYKALWSSLAAEKFINVHCHEIIEELSPCHLYFDLEFPREYNQGVDGNALVVSLMVELERVLLRRWEVSLRNAFVMEMDSSSETKFSRHLVIRFKDFAFRRNSEIRPIVKEILSNSAQGQFVVRKSSGTSCFIDEGVYSRNRCFRMLWCSKSDKPNRLKPTRRFSMREYEVEKGRQETKRMFFLSLICNVNPDVEFFDVGFQSGLNSSSLVDSIRIVYSDGRSVEVLEGNGTSDMEKRAVSLVPTIERLVGFHSKSVAKVNKMKMLGYDGLVSYNFVGPGSHCCSIAGRAHRSNNVYYLVRLSSLEYQQRCYDPDCDNSRARWNPIPDFVLNVND